MKKKIIIIVVVTIILIVFLYNIINKLKINNVINNTIKYEDKINYSTNIILSIKTKETSSKIDYDKIKSSNIEKITISNYLDQKLENRMIEYVVKENNKKTIYKYNGDTYEKTKNIIEDFKIDYEKLKHGKTKKLSKQKYVIKMKSYDAYNMLYSRKILSDKDTNKTIDVNIVVDIKNDFIKEISYEIDDINDNSIKYKVKLENRDINNHNKITLPF